MSSAAGPAGSSTGLRRGELIAAVSAGVLLLASLLTWFEPNVAGAQLDALEQVGEDPGRNAWQSFALTDLLIGVAVITGLALAAGPLTQRTSATRVTLSVVATPLSAVVALVVVYRTLINQPQEDDLIKLGFGAYLGALAAIGVCVGAFMSLADESEPDREQPEVATQPPPDPGAS